MVNPPNSNCRTLEAAPPRSRSRPTGRVWFTEGGGNRIGRMNPDGTGLKEFDLPHPGSQPRIIALGADKNMWFSEHLGNRMGRITPVRRNRRVRYPHARRPSPAPSRWAATAISGSASSKAARSAASRPTGMITEFPIPTPDSGPRALSAGPDGNVWFSEFNTAKIGRITPQGKITEFTLAPPRYRPWRHHLRRRRQPLVPGTRWPHGHSRGGWQSRGPHHSCGSDHRIRRSRLHTADPSTSPSVPIRTSGSPAAICSAA